MTEQPITEDKVRTEEKTGRSAWLGTAGWYPLLILFGLNMTDELDRSAFSVLLPEIRDHFGLDNSGILWVVAVAGAVALLLTVPIASWPTVPTGSASPSEALRCGRRSPSVPASPCRCGCW